MSLLTDIICIGADLLRLKIQVEAKYLGTKFEEVAKSLHSCLKQLYFFWGMLAFFIAMLAGGVGFIMWGGYALLASVINPGFAALIVGLIVSLIAITVLGVIKKTIK